MIKNILEIKNFGVFQDYKNNIQDFSKFNLFYGWNGSGKSTLSNLFRYMTTTKNEDRFKDLEFKIELQSGQIITKDKIDNSEKIFVFNEEFIKHNIDWNDTVKSILMISEEKIEERKKLNELSVNLDKQKIELKNCINNFDEYNKNIDKMLTETAKDIKKQFSTLNTSDTYYINYNRAKLKKIIEDDSLNDLKGILSENEVVEVKDIIKPQKKEKINMMIEKIEMNSFKHLMDNINRVLAITVVSNTIEEFLENYDLARWVQEGMNLHYNTNSKICKFCGGILNDDRLNQLNNHFNDNFKKFQTEITVLNQDIENLVKKLDYNIEISSLYDELKSEAINIKENVIIVIKRLKIALKEINDKLENKKSNPFILIEKINFNMDILNEYNMNINKFNEIINRHNKKCDDFTNVIKVNQNRLEKHYALKFIQESSYRLLKKNIEKCNKNINILTKEINRLENEVKVLENSISNEGLAIPYFNNMLATFLGHREIELEFDSIKKGYRIIRKETREQAQNLSEGERTAIAFIYFVIKLKENGNRIEESIVVLDDPISSFDSKHIHNAYSYIKNEIEDCRQLFILTHNFTFFRLVRDWIITKNKRGIIKSRLYKVEVVNYNPKVSNIIDMDEALKKYNSEYHYLFTKLFSYAIKPNLSLEETFMAANTSRKLLEAFMSFKKPKDRGNFKSLFDNCVSDAYLRERVYKFINQYSHYSPVVMGDESIDNLLAESSEIIIDVFKIYKSLDEIHLSEMIDISKKCLNEGYNRAELEAAITKI